MKPYDLILLALCNWRESRGEPLLITRQAQAWSVRNRVYSPRWWGHSWSSVVLMPFQYSSFNHNDINATKFPMEVDKEWEESLAIAADIGADNPMTKDMTGGATSYFDMSLDLNPPKWATDGSQVKTVDFGRFHFYKVA